VPRLRGAKPFFLFPQRGMERREAPGACEAPWGCPCDRAARAPLFRGQGCESCPEARAPHMRRVCEARRRDAAPPGAPPRRDVSPPERRPRARVRAATCELTIFLIVERCQATYVDVVLSRRWEQASPAYDAPCRVRALRKANTPVVAPRRKRDALEIAQPQVLGHHSP
jgi:hypothetical protein